MFLFIDKVAIVYSAPNADAVSIIYLMNLSKGCILGDF